MNHRELQQKLKQYRDQGLTTIKLTTAKIDLEAELARIESFQVTEEPATVSQTETQQGVNNNFQSFEPFDPLMIALELEETAQTDEDREYRNKLADAAELADKVNNFLLAVRRKELSDEQLGAIAVALVVSNGKEIPVSEALGKGKQFHLFSPNKLLAWGFDEFIPSESIFNRFKNAIAKSKSLKANVIVQYVPTDPNDSLLSAWAKSYQGEQWASGTIEESGNQVDNWAFPEISLAENFAEYCNALDFVKSAKVDHILLSQREKFELEMAS